MEPHRYILSVLRSIKTTELEQTMLVIPLRYVKSLFSYLILLLKTGLGVEICSRVVIFLVKTHQNQIIANKTFALSLCELKKLINIRLNEYHDIMGYNLAAMQVITKISKEKISQEHNQLP